MQHRLGDVVTARAAAKAEAKKARKKRKAELRGGMSKEDANRKLHLYDAYDDDIMHTLAYSASINSVEKDDYGRKSEDWMYVRYGMDPYRVPMAEWLDFESAKAGRDEELEIDELDAEPMDDEDIEELNPANDGPPESEILEAFAQALEAFKDYS